MRLSLDKVTLTLGGRTLVRSLSLTLKPGEVIGLLGPNGAGKTTLFRMITGQQEPDSGSLKIGSTVELGYVDQSRVSLRDDNSVYQ